MGTKILVSMMAALLSVGAAYAGEGVAPASATTPPPVVREATSGMELAFVKGGCFKMGDLYGDGKLLFEDGQRPEEPVHEVCLDSFYMGRTEVTRRQWKAVMGDVEVRARAAGGPIQDDLCVGDDCPVGNVSWKDVDDFLAKLNAREGGVKYRLPTEAEWEYAARAGGKVTRYSGGNDVESVSWYEETSGYRPNPGGALAHPVAQKLPNALGLYDMSGNVWELTADWYQSDYYAVSPRENPRGPASGESRVLRGGCASGRAVNSRVSRRSQSWEPLPLDGFRVLRVP